MLAVTSIFGNWFDGENFSVWKLNTVWDYIFFALVILAGVAFFAWITHILKRHRNHPDAVKRVAKRLAKLGGKGSRCYIDKTLRTVDGDQDYYELINVALDRIYLVKVFHYGLEVIGDAKAKEWQFRYNKDIFMQENPLYALDEKRIVMTRHMIRCNLRNVPIQTLVVFADNFGTTNFSLPGVKNAVPYSRLRTWRKTYPLHRTAIDIPAVCAALEKGFVENETKVESKEI